jgi:3-oxoadipate enol-lactonase
MDSIVTVDGIGLRVRIDGPEGAPWLVFSNSLMTDLSLWDDQVAAFGDRYRILRYDQRGHGGSAVPPGNCSFDRLVDDFAAVLAHFDVTGATIVGVSMGGVTALGLASRHPKRAARVLLCDCQPISTPAGAAAWDERFELVRNGGMAALVEPTIARWFRPAAVQANTGAVSRVRAMIGGMTPDGFMRAGRALQDYDFRSDLAALAHRACPVACVVGAHDGVLPDAVRAMAATCPGATFTAIADAGHLPNIEQPAAFNEALTTLLTRS